MGRVKLSLELVEDLGDDVAGKCERIWRGSKWPWKKISSAGERSSACEFGDLDLLPGNGVEKEW